MPNNKKPTVTLIAALLGFFMITLDAVIVNVALPAMGKDLGAGITGLQWIVDSYTLMFAALLLSAGALTDQVGARKAFTIGLILFIIASVACGFAPNLTIMMIARFLQGSAAAVLMPSSMALLSQAYPDRKKRARAVAIWALGGSVASSSGPVLGGILSEFDWRMIFFINVPVGGIALLLTYRAAHSKVRKVPFDWMGQVTAIIAMVAIIYGVIETGEKGFPNPVVLGSLGLGIVALIAFIWGQLRVAHPMVPSSLFSSPNVALADVIGFAFMVGYFGLPFLMSLYLQQVRELSALDTGFAFLPMMIVGAIFTPFSAWFVEKFGAKRLIASGLILMTIGLVLLAYISSSTPIWTISGLMILVGFSGPFISPPIMAVLLNSVSDDQAGTASGVFNTSRQFGGALAIAIFGALVTQPGSFIHGMRIGLLLAAGVALLTAFISLRLQPTN